MLWKNDDSKKESRQANHDGGDGRRNKAKDCALPQRQVQRRSYSVGNSLTQEEIDKLEPLWEKSFEIEEVINEVMLIDKRKNLEDFESIESPVKKIFDDYTNANEDFMDDETWLEYAEDATNQVINLLVER